MGIAVLKAMGRESPWSPWSVIYGSGGLKRTLCVSFEVKFHHLPVAHPAFYYVLPRSVVCLGESSIPALRCC